MRAQRPSCRFCLRNEHVETVDLPTVSGRQSILAQFPNRVSDRCAWPCPLRASGNEARVSLAHYKSLMLLGVKIIRSGVERDRLLVAFAGVSHAAIKAGQAPGCFCRSLPRSHQGLALIAGWYADTILRISEVGSLRVAAISAQGTIGCLTDCARKKRGNRKEKEENGISKEKLHTLFFKPT